MKLVGFLLHPISRSETWRRLFLPRASCDAGYGTKQTPQKPLAQSKMQANVRLVGMPILEGPERRIGSRNSVPDRKNFLKLSEAEIGR
jgi:hypothetical protein